VVGGFGELFKFFAAAGFEEVELLATVRESGEGDAEEADFAFGVAVVTEEIEEDGEDVSVELGGFWESFGAGVGFEAGVTDGEREGAGREAGFAKALAGFLG